MSGQIEHRRYTIGDVRRLIASGVIHIEAEVELIDGKIVEMAPAGGKHVECVMLCSDQLSSIPEKAWYVSVRNALLLASDCAPRPDLALLQRRAYYGQLPGPEDTYLIVEVDDQTSEHDLRVKVPLFARFGIPEVWLIDVAQFQIRRYTAPEQGIYTRVQTFEHSETINSTSLPTISLPVASVFGSDPAAS